MLVNLKRKFDQQRQILPFTPIKKLFNRHTVEKTIAITYGHHGGPVQQPSA